MPDTRRRLAACCRHALAAGAVLATMVPAAGVTTLDIAAPPAPGQPMVHGDGHTTTGSLVASAPVQPEVREVPLDGVEPRGVRALRTTGTGDAPTGGLRPVGYETTSGDTSRDRGELAALSAPEPVSGYATVGVTWEPGAVRGADGVTLAVRTRDEGTWSPWQRLPWDPEEGPDPDSAEGRRSNPGTDPVVVGDVDSVQVRALTPSGETPAGMRLALVDPGPTVAAKVEEPAIDTARLASASTAGSAYDVTPKPQIFSRAQWGADESMRDPSTLHYYEVHAGFVHHTVNANGYSRRQVPAIIRGIYAYHTRAKGWSDIGYNFLVDRFGRIWEGRYGGVDRPVVGAHTLGYNEYSFAMSAIGNYDVYDKGRGVPSQAMLDAYGRLFAWKLSLHGVDASSTRQWVGSRYLPAINGHRDVGQTACPGGYLYAKVPTIRALAAQYQHPFTGREKKANLSGTHWPDLVVRDADTKRVWFVRTAGQAGFLRPQPAADGWRGMDLVTAVRDVTGDGVADVMGRVAATGETSLYPGTGDGHFGSATRSTQRFAALDQLVGVGDLDGDGENDLVGRDAASGRLLLFRGTGNGGFQDARTLSSDWSGYDLTVGAGDLAGDGHQDLLARGGGTLWLVPGTGGGLGAPVALPGRWGGFDLLAALGDVTNDGRPDVVARARASRMLYVYPGDGHGGLTQRYGPYTGFEHVDRLAVAGQVAGNRRADHVARNGAGQLLVFPNNGRRNVGGVVATNRTFPGANLILSVGDWNGDGHGDVVTRSRRGDLVLYPGEGGRRLGDPVRMARGFGGVRLLAAVGDITGDGHPDLMGQPKGHAMRIYPGNGTTGLRRSYVAHSGIGADDQVGAGLWDSDGSPDSIVRRADGTLVLYPGNGPGGLTVGHKIGGHAKRYSWMQGVGDADGDGFPDVMARDGAGRLWLLPGAGDGFGKRRFVAAGFEGYDLGS
jgi:hypothetical protein